MLGKAATLLLFLLVAHAASAAERCAVGAWPSGVPPGSIELAEYPIVDRALSRPGKAVPWGSVLAPTGWTASDGMAWSQRYACSRTAQDDRWTLASPDGAVQISLLPEERWKIQPRFPGGGTASSCEQRPYERAESFLLDILKRLTIPARSLTPRERPDILASRSPAEVQRARYEFFEEGISAAELSFKFKSKSGPRDALLISIVTVTGTSPYIPEQDVHGASAVTLLASFPEGKFDARLVETIRRSGFFNSNWSRIQWQRMMRDARIEPGDTKMKEAMTERPDDDRPLGKSQLLGGQTFTEAGVADVWRTDAGRYFLFPAGALPSGCAEN
jgi:hypothetical protein